MATNTSSLFTALVGAELRVWNSLEAALTEAGNPLSLGRFLVLRTGRDTRACRIQEVAESQGITLGAASRLVDRLHRDGLLHRTPCEHDRRAIILTVTDAGIDHLASAETIVAAEQDRLFAPLSPNQRDSLARALTLIAEASENTWLRTGKRIDGLMFSCTSLGVKVGGGLGTALSGWLLAASGYDGNLKVQPESAIQMIYVMYVWLPLVANALILFLLMRLDVEKVNTRLKEEADTRAEAEVGVGVAGGGSVVLGEAGGAVGGGDVVGSSDGTVGTSEGEDSTS